MRFSGQPGDGELESCTHISWAFGDGTTDTGRDVIHSFILPGTYLVQESIENALGKLVASSTVQVSPRCEPPVIVHAPALGPSFSYFVLRNSMVAIHFDVYSAQPVRYFWYRNSAYVTETESPELVVGPLTEIADYTIEMNSSCGGTRGVVVLIPVNQLPKHRAVHH